jgi:hypothetical protein
MFEGLRLLSRNESGGVALEALEADPGDGCVFECCDEGGLGVN